MYPTPAAALEARLARLDAEQLRDVVRHLAVHHPYPVAEAAEAVAWRRAHPELVAR